MRHTVRRGWQLCHPTRQPPLLSALLLVILLAACAPPRPPNTRVPERPTDTATLPPPTHTPTHTPRPPTATITKTPLQPTDTHTPRPPSATPTSPPTATPTQTNIPGPAGYIIYVAEQDGVRNLWMLTAGCIFADTANACTPTPVTDATDGIILALPHPDSPTHLAYLGPAPLIELPETIKHIDRPELYAACVAEHGACRRVLLTPEEAALYVLDYPGNAQSGDLYRVDIASGDTLPLYAEEGAPVMHDAYWLPDGTFIEELDGLNRIIVHSQDPEPHSAASGIACAGYPEAGYVVGSESAWLSWTPDGARIAAACRLVQETMSGTTHVLGAVLNIYDLAEDKALITPPEPADAPLDMAPFWLPDGETVVFTRAAIMRGAGATTPDSPVTLGPRAVWAFDVTTGQSDALIADSARNYTALGWVGDMLLVRETPYTEETYPQDDVWAWDAVLQRDDGAVYWLMDPHTNELTASAADTPHIPGAPCPVRRESETPDGAWVVAEREGALWLLDTMGNVYRLIEHGSYPVWAH